MFIGVFPDERRADHQGETGQDKTGQDSRDGNGSLAFPNPYGTRAFMVFINIVLIVVVVLISTHELVPVVAVMFKKDGSSGDGDTSSRAVMGVLIVVLMLLVVVMVVLMLMVLVLELQAAVLRDLGGLHDWSAGEQTQAASFSLVPGLWNGVGGFRRCRALAGKHSATWRASKLESSG